MKVRTKTKTVETVTIELTRKEAKKLTTILANTCPKTIQKGAPRKFVGSFMYDLNQQLWDQGIPWLEHYTGWNGDNGPI